MLVYDVIAQQRLRAFSIPEGTHNFVFSVTGDTPWLMAAAAGIYRVDPTDGRVTGHVLTPTPARGLTWMPDVSVVDIEHLTVDSLGPVGGPNGLAIVPH